MEPEDSRALTLVVPGLKEVVAVAVGVDDSDEGMRMRTGSIELAGRRSLKHGNS